MMQTELAEEKGNALVGRAAPDGASNIEFVDTGAGGFESVGKLESVRFLIARGQTSSGIITSSIVVAVMFPMKVPSGARTRIWSPLLQPLLLTSMRTICVVKTCRKA